MSRFGRVNWFTPSGRVQPLIRRRADSDLHGAEITRDLVTRGEMLLMQEFDQFVTFLYTKDLEASSQFLSGALGLRLVLDQGRCRIFRVAPHSYLGVCEREDPPVPSGLIVTLVTDDVDEWHERLRDAGVTIEKAPAHNPDYDIYHMFFRDPNGYLFEIQRFLDSSWPRD